MVHADNLIESALFGLRFDDKMNLTEMRVGQQRYRFRSRSRYVVSGEEAHIESVKASPGCIRARLGTRSTSGELIITGRERLSIEVKLKGSEPIENIELNFPFPEDTKMIKTEQMPEKDEIEVTTFQVKLQSSFIDVGKNVLMFGTRTKKLYFSNSKFIKTKEGLSLSWNWEPKAPFPTDYVTPKLYFEVFPSINKAIEDYEDWMESTFEVQRKQDNPRVPEWLSKTRLILIIDMWMPVGDVTHTYDDVIRLIGEMHKMRVPQDTIIYLTGWSWKYDAHYPEYWPADELGGARKFQALVELARQCGYHVMPHFNHQALDPDLPIFKKFREYQQRDPYGNRRQYPEPYVEHPSSPIAYMNPAAGPWRDYVVGKITKPVRKFGLDAAFIDQVSIQWNTLDNQLEGQIKLVDELYEKTPGILLAGEAIGHEATIGIVPLTQINVVSKVLYSTPVFHHDGLFQTRPKAYLTKEWLFKDIKLASDYYYLFPWFGVIPAVPGKYPYIFFRYVTEVGFEKAFRNCQNLADELGLIKTLRLNYREYGIDPLSRKEIEGLA